MNYINWLVVASSELIGSESPKRDAEILLEYVTGRTRTFLMAFSETLLTEQQLQQLTEMLMRRKRGEPIAYIIGEKEFWSLSFMVSPVTLIPRPDTEKLVELALERLPLHPCQILDLGTGTGAIAIALATERPDCLITGIDYQVDAVKLAQNNAKKIGVNNVFFLQGDWFKPVKNRQFSMIVSNPPYIDSTDMCLLKGDVRFEPASALIANEQGLSAIKQIVIKAKAYLELYGWLLIEHGWQQGTEVRRLFKQQGFELVETFTDYGGNERVTLGRGLKK